LVTLPLLAKSLAAGAAKYPHYASALLDTLRHARGRVDNSADFGRKQLGFARLGLLPSALSLSPLLTASALLI